MSFWYNAEEEDIDINFNEKEVNVFVPHENDQGSIYTILSFEQIQAIAKKIADETN